MTEVIEEQLSAATRLLSANLPHDTEHSARILLASLVAVLEGAMVGVEVMCHDQDGVAWVFAHRGVPGVESSLRPIARIQ